MSKMAEHKNCSKCIACSTGLSQEEIITMNYNKAKEVKMPVIVPIIDDKTEDAVYIFTVGLPGISDADGELVISGTSINNGANILSLVSRKIVDGSIKTQDFKNGLVLKVEGLCGLLKVKILNRQIIEQKLGSSLFTGLNLPRSEQAYHLIMSDENGQFIKKITKWQVGQFTK